MDFILIILENVQELLVTLKLDIILTAVWLVLISNIMFYFAGWLHTKRIGVRVMFGLSAVIAFNAGRTLAALLGVSLANLSELPFFIFLVLMITMLGYITYLTSGGKFTQALQKNIDNEKNCGDDKSNRGA
jgi:hypothetical protein